MLTQKLQRRLLGAALAAVTLTASAWAGVTKAEWGKTAAGVPVQLYTLTDAQLTVKITTFGARIVGVEAPDRDGKKADVVLGYNDVASYEADKGTYFGAIVGRYGNRVAKGKFVIDGQTFQVPPNNNGNALHGGPLGFDHKVWTAKQVPNGVEMTLVSPDGDQGFPGELTAHVRYTLLGSSLQIRYTSTSTKPTVVNLTNHAYFNLAGESSGMILKQELAINASRYTPVDDELIPTGLFAKVERSPFDFNKSTAIGERIEADDPQLTIGKGYDHNWVLSKPNNSALPHGSEVLGIPVNDSVLKSKDRYAARAFDPNSGRTLTVFTSEPGVQFYSGNFLDGTLTGKSGVKYVRRSGFCLETQHFPDSPNRANFPSTVLRPGKTLRSSTTFVFGVSK